MKKIVNIIIVSSLLFIFLGIVKGEQYTPVNSHRVRENIDFDWKFYKGDISGAENPEFDDTGWRNVDLPHDWAIEEGPYTEDTYNGGSLPKGISWYRKYFTLSSYYEKRKIFVDFDGVAGGFMLWINGHFLGQFQPYLGSIIDITEYVHFGEAENLLAVKVWGGGYEGAGIAQHIWLLITDRVHISPYGTFVTTPGISDGMTLSQYLDEVEDLKTSALVNIKTKVKNETTTLQQCILVSHIVDADNNIVETMESSQFINSNEEYEFTQQTSINNPYLWSPDNPYLYTVYSIVKKGEKIVDTYKTPLGFRWFYFDANEGFFYNGDYMKIKGIGCRYSHEGVGRAMPDRLYFHDLEAIRGMGTILINPGHIPAARVLADACDKFGMFYWEEYLYGNSPSNTEKMILRDRNHPSLMAWGVNVPGTQCTLASTQNDQILHNTAKQCDPTRPTFSHIEGGCDHNLYGDADVVDIAGYDYESPIDADHTNYPERKIFVTEVCCGFGTRGVYNNTEYFYNMYSHCLTQEREWKFEKDRKFISGGGIWTGWDCFGENFPRTFPAICNQFGQLDLCRFPKDSYYYYKSLWTTEPMIHIFPHWTWPGKEGNNIEVWCYTNCDTAELFLNDVSQGTKTKPTDMPWHLVWNIPYTPGTLKAIGRIGGEIVATEEYHTTGTPAKIKLEPDRNIITADGRDVSFVKISILDSDNNLCPTANNLINFNITGSGKNIGVGNGNPTFVGDRKAMFVDAFNGLCMILIQSTTQPGQINLVATSSGLSSDSIIIETIPPNPVEIVATLEPQEFLADGISTSTIRAEIRDEYGCIIPVATNTVTFTLTGVGSLPGGTTVYTANAIGGVATAVVYSTTTPGIGEINITIDNLISASVDFSLISLGEPKKLSVKASKDRVNTLEPEVINIEANIEDEHGYLITTATNTVTFTINGKGIILGNNVVIADKGKASCSLQTTSTPGLVFISASSQGLETDVSTITVIGPPNKITIFCEPQTIISDGLSTSQITANICDEGDNRIDTVTSTICFRVKGDCCRLPNSKDTYLVQAEKGIATALLTSTTMYGKAIITAEGEGLESDETEVNVLSTENTRLFLTASSTLTYVNNLINLKVEIKNLEGEIIPISTKIVLDVSGPGNNRAEKIGETVNGIVNFENILLGESGIFNCKVKGVGIEKSLLVTVFAKEGEKAELRSNKGILDYPVKLQIPQNSLSKDRYIIIKKFSELDEKTKGEIKVANAFAKENAAIGFNEGLIKETVCQFEIKDSSGNYVSADFVGEKATLILPFADRDMDSIVDETNINENQLEIFYLDKDNLYWKLLGKTGIDNWNNFIIFSQIENINNSDIYCLMGVNPASPPEEKLEITKLTNYPNPFKEETRFIFNLGCNAKVEIKIYTIKGRLINDIKNNGVKGDNEIIWDGKDKEGKEISNGVYIYKIIAEVEDNSIEKIGKLTKIK